MTNLLFEQPGFVPETASYLARADVYVLPSLQEGSGSIALIEALQASLPAVASDVDGIPEDAGPGRGALLVPERRERGQEPSVEPERGEGGRFGGPQGHILSWNGINSSA